VKDDGAGMICQDLPSSASMSHVTHASSFAAAAMAMAAAFSAAAATARCAAAVAASRQGLTLLHFRAQRKHLL
jgi:predicted lipoprotein with Yx(FWY)xxD motif